MIDNQADYDRIFRAKTRLQRSPSYQSVATPAAVIPQSNSQSPSSSGGFSIQMPVVTDISLNVLSTITNSSSAEPVLPTPKVRLAMIITSETPKCTVLDRCFSSCDNY